ncbi:MAG: cysteine--tRNA ligase [Planctomycetota bacterium]|nr:cysteine--tRNA ligase [Planctomycetota bacterium]
MTIRVYNTLTRRSEPLTPLTPGKIGIYLCGPTVYDDCHIGHLMGPVLFDAIARWLRVRGYDVRFVNNITDIDDKIIERSQRSGEPWQEITRRYSEQYFALLRRLHVATITDHPRCTDFVPQMIRYIADLLAAGRAYVTPDGVVYDVQQQPGYGKLSGRRLEEMVAGARVERDPHLRHPADFALWKRAGPGEPSWDSPWGPGRPGWHIECSVMTYHTLGPDFDIHAGGEELKFPHHENEIAQGEAHGGGYARVWMHHNLVQYQGSKIAKSDPRMRDPAFAEQFKAWRVLDAHGAPAIRYLLLSGHYRRPVDFAPAAIAAVRTALQRLLATLGERCEAPATLCDAAGLAALLERALPERAAQARAAFIAAMDDDFNTGAAIAQLHILSHEAHKEAEDSAARAAILDVLAGLGRILGLFQPGDRAQLASTAGGDERLAKVMELVLELRAQARARRDFATSDFIRERLQAAGITVRDGRDGTTWS